MNNPRLSTITAPVMRNHRLGSDNPPPPMTYSAEQLDMLRHHFERSGAPTNRIGLDHYLSTCVPDNLRESIMAQLFPGHSTQHDYAQDLINAGVPVTAVRKSLAMVMAPADRERLLREVIANAKPYDFPYKRCALGQDVEGEREARAEKETMTRALQLEAA